VKLAPFKNNKLKFQKSQNFVIYQKKRVILQPQLLTNKKIKMKKLPITSHFSLLTSHLLPVLGALLGSLVFFLNFWL